MRKTNVIFFILLLFLFTLVDILSAQEKPEAAPAAASPAEAPPPETPPASAAETPAAAPAAVPAVRTIEEQRLNTLLYGTETEISNLIQTLKNEKVSYLDKELIEIANNSRNRNILGGIFSFFGEAEKSGLEDRAIRAIAERDEEANDTVLAAIDYLGRVKAAQAVQSLQELINSGENRFLNPAIRALGRTAKGLGDTEEAAGKSDEIAIYLLDYYNNRSPVDENRREIIVALGETGSKTAVSFLTGIIKSQDERAVLRMAALDAVSKIGDPEGLDAIIKAVSSTDPNVRSSAIAALGPFSMEAADQAILEGFRDS